MYGLSPTIIVVVITVDPFITDLAVGKFGPIICSGYACLAEVLQYTVYAVMMPFFGMGGDHRADSWLGEPGTVDTEKFNGGDGTVDGRLQIQVFLIMHKLITAI